MRKLLFVVSVVSAMVAQAWEVGDDIILGEGESFAIPAGVTRVGDVKMAAGSTLQLPSDVSDITFASLNGDGTITTAYAGGDWAAQTLNIGDAGSTPPECPVSVFAGKFEGYLCLCANWTLTLTNEESAFANTHIGHIVCGISGDDTGLHGVLEVKKFGAIGQASSVGPADNIQLRQGGTLRYLGKGETTTHGLTPLHLGVNLDSCVDGGAFGGLNWAGEWYCSLADVFCRMTVTGSNTTACVMSGAMNFDAAQNGMSCYFTKDGTGTWSFAGNSNRPKMCGPFAVREGTLQFDTLFNTGVSCSLGTSTALYDAPGGSGMSGAEQYKVDYAFLLGGGENPVFEFIGSGENATDRKIALTGGKSTIAATGAGKISFNGGVKAFDEGLKTLHLAGSAYIADITDGAGKVSVVKEGAGEWTLGGELSFSGLFEVAEGKATVVADSGKVQLANAGVKVAPGATLAASGVELKTITIDASAGNGTFEGVAFAKDGAIDIVNFQSASATVAMAFKDVDAGSFANLPDWKVKVDGAVRSDVKVTFNDDYTVTIVIKTWQEGDDIILGEGESFAIPAGVTRVGDVKMAAGSTLQLPSDVSDITFASLNGDGTITTAYAGGDWAAQTLNIGDAGSTPPECPVSVFAGKFEGYLCLCANCTLTLTNEESAFANTHIGHIVCGISGDDTGLHGVLEVKKFGAIGQASSVGPADNIQLRQGGTLRYLGKGETTNHGLTPLHLGVNLDSCVDGGAFGGLNWAGEWYCSLADVFCRMTVTGSNTTACVMSGAMNFDAAPNGMSCYFTKDGTGTWSFAGNSNRPKMCGPFAVREGTLQFDTLFNTGVSCSLGTSTALYDAPGGSGMSGAEQYKVDYAFLLGGGENPVFEFIGSGENATDRKIALTGGKSTIAATGAGKISFNGGVKAFDEGLKTLHLAGSAAAGSAYIADIADGAGKVSVVKEGAGEWTLGGELSFSGLFEVAEGKATVVADSGKVQLANAGVKVAPGATLAASGSFEFGQPLVIDALVGAGKLMGFAIADGGVIAVTNFSKTMKSVNLPVLDGCTGSFAGWQVVLQGDDADKYAAVVDGSQIKIRKVGTMLMVK